MELGFILLYISAFLAVCAAISLYLDRTRPRKTRQTEDLTTSSSLPPADLSMLPPQFIVADIETTGLDPNNDEIIEIAAVRVNRDSIRHDTFEVLIKPSVRLPKTITEMTGITDKMLEKDGDTLECAITEFLDFVGDLPLVFYNAPFDMGFLDRAAAVFDKRINNPVSCALKMSRRAFPDLPSYKLGDVARYLNLSTEGTHRALKDCELTITIHAVAASTLHSKQFRKKKPVQDSTQDELQVYVKVSVEGQTDKDKEYWEKYHRERRQRQQNMVERDVKEVAKMVRQYVRNKYPQCKFSVFIQRSDYSDDLNIHLMEAPFPAFGPGWSKTELRRGHAYLSPYHYAPGEGPYNDSRRLAPEAMTVVGNVAHYAESLTDSVSIGIGKEDRPFVQKDA